MPAVLDKPLSDLKKEPGLVITSRSIYPRQLVQLSGDGEAFVLRCYVQLIRHASVWPYGTLASIE